MPSKLILCLSLACRLLASPRAGLAQPSHAPHPADTPARTRLSREEALADLDILARRLRAEAAYIELHQARPCEALERLKARLPDPLSVADLTRDLQKVLSPIGDCHSSATSQALDGEPGLWLPFRLAPAQGGIVAVTRENNAFAEPGFPYLAALDGVPLRDWLEAALKYEPVGSATQNLYAALKGIRRLDILRRDLGLAASPNVTVTFANAAGHHKTTALPCRTRFSNFAKLSLGDNRLIGKIGYLRLPAMDDALIPETIRRMAAYRDTDGLIIDVRGNGGGTYGLMRTLFGYFRPAEASPFVCNIAAYRLAPQFKTDHIEYRPTHRRDWPGWSRDELDAIDAAMRSFSPSFALPEGQFSEWHFMVLTRQAHHFHYDKPVIVLCDEACISATDGFLAAFSELPRVTLMGVGSRGGSGSSRSARLPHSGISITLSTMASFRPNGDTFDGKGVAADVHAQPPPEDFITGKDTVLEEALKRLN